MRFGCYMCIVVRAGRGGEEINLNMFHTFCVFVCDKKNGIKNTLTRAKASSSAIGLNVVASSTEKSSCLNDIKLKEDVDDDNDENSREEKKNVQNIKLFKMMLESNPFN